MTLTSMPTVDEILDRLREHGGRITTARRVVVAALIDTPRHVTAEDIAAVIQHEHPEVHLSTVYRTLESLEDLGIVRHTHIGHGASVYHVGPTHQHLVCEECGTVVDAPIELLEPLRAELGARYGFQLRPGHSALLGLCPLHARI